MLKVRLPKLNKRTWIAVLAVVVLALGFSFFFFTKQSPSAEAGWWNEDWRYRKKLTIDQTKIDADLTDFPVAIILTSSNFTYANAQTAGQDIRFTDTNGTPLPHEIEKWNSSATSTLWVKVPAIDDVVDTTIYMYYGNGGVADGQKATDVWDDDFVMVQHMNNTATGTDDFVDSTKYNNDGTGAGSGTSLVATSSGRIDGAFEVDGNDDHVEVPDDISLDGMSQLTMSGWVYFDQLPSTVAHDVELMVKRHSTDPWNSYYFDIINTGGGCPADNVMYVSLKNQSEGADYHCANTSLTASQWYFVATTWDGSNIHFYLNGANDDYGDTSFSGTSIFASNGTLYINGDDSGPGRIDGKIDDVRISKITRSAAWFKAEYNNGINALVTIDTEEKGPGPVAYWGFEEGYGNIITDLSSNGHTLISSSTVWKEGSECISGKCLYFNGTNSIATTTNTNALNISGSEITLTAWFKPDTLSGKKMLLDKGSYAVHWNYGFGLNNSGLLMRHNNGDKTTSNVTLNSNQWHHFTAVYSGGNDYFYLDGVLVESMTDSGWSEQTGTQQLTLGAAFQTGVGYSEFFHGYLDEVKVYDYARSLDQIRQDYNKGLSVSLGNSNPYASLSDGLVAWWKMDGDLTDASGNGNTGTASGAVATGTAKFGKAYTIGGSTNYISANTSASLDSYTDKLTVAGWYYINTMPGTQAWFFDKGNNYYLRFDSGGGITNYLFGINNEDYWSTQAGLVTAGSWYHVVFSYDGQERKVYINGELKASKKDTGSISTGGTFNIGNRNSHGEPMDGQVDEIRVYNRTLSSDEVRRLSEWAPPPVAYWKMDENSGTTAYDSIGGNNLTLGYSTFAEPSWESIGRYGSTLNLHGNTQAEAAGIDDANLSSDFPGKDGTGTNYGMSAMAWVKLRDNTRQDLLCRGSGSWCFWIDANSHLTEYATQIFGNIVIPINEWTHIAYTYDGQTAKLYVNGILDVAQADTGGIPEYGSPFLIGSVGAEDNPDGLVDDAKVYNYARTQRQILEDMHAGKKNNPIAYWSFDEGQGGTAYDFGFLATVGSGRNGTLTNMTTSGPSTTWSNNGKSGKALQFDGSDDEVTISNSTNLTPYDQSRSVSLWFMANELGVQQGLMTTGDVAQEDSPLWLIALMDNNVMSVYQSGYKDGKTVIERNKWYHFVYTYDVSDDSLKLYLNGELEYSGIHTPSNNDSANIFIGSGWSSAFQGLIDEVKIYNYPITIDEIRQNMNVGKQISLSRGANSNQTEGLLLWWKMDEASWNGTSGEVKDGSGNGNHGTAGYANSTSTAKFGRAGNLDGDTDTVSISTSGTSLAGIETSDLTMSVWLKTNTVVKSFADISNADSSAYFMHLVNNGSIVRAYFYLNGTEQKVLESDSGSITVGPWYHMAVTRDYQSGDTILYLNGVEVDRLKAVGTTGYSPTSIGLGNGSSYCFDGQLDDFKIYNTVRTPAQIMSEYADGPSPVGHWKLDDLSGTTAVDASGNGNNGVFTGGPVWKEKGKVGSSLFFDGADDWLSVASSSSLHDTGNTTFSFWVNPESFTNKLYPTIYNRNGQSSTDGFNWIYFNSDGNISYQYANGSAPVIKNLATAVPLNSWSYITIVHDRTEKTVKAYKNGVFIETETYTDTALPVVNGISYIGTYNNSSTNYPFQGQLDDFKIYNYALTPRQIVKEYNSGGPVGYWKMDESEGVAVKDYSGQANHGSLVVGSGGTQSATSSAWTNGVNGKINSSLNFDGSDDRVNLGSVTTGENVTIASWIKTTNGSQKPIFSNRGNGVYYGISSGTFFIYDNSASPSPGMNSNKTINDGSWHHVVWTSNGSSSVMYIDGELDSRQAQSRGSDSGTAYIAWDSANGTEYFPGQIDELKIWNYELTPEEVKKEYNGGFSSYFK